MNKLFCRVVKRALYWVPYYLNEPIKIAYWATPPFDLCPAGPTTGAGGFHRLLRWDPLQNMIKQKQNNTD